MDYQITLVIITLGLVVSATSMPSGYREEPVTVVRMVDPRPMSIPVAERRQHSGPPRLPFEAISGPYQSSSIGPVFRTGGYGGLGVPFSSGPMGGIMGFPLMALLG